MAMRVTFHGRLISKIKHWSSCWVLDGAVVNSNKRGDRTPAALLASAISSKAEARLSQNRITAYALLYGL